MVKTTEQENPREADYPVDEIFLKRWSPRAMNKEKIDAEELMSLFEAARWSPSSYNNQPWKFLYAHRETENWEKFFNLLGDFNKEWCESAGVLVIILSRKNFHHNDKPSRTHSFDTGSAWMSLALQASMKGLVAHGMEGFDYDEAREVLNIPEGYDIEAMVAIGKPGDIEDLSDEMREKEKPNSRKKISEFAFEGEFKK